MGYFVGVVVLIPFGVIYPLKISFMVMEDGLLLIPTGIRKIKINIKDIVSVADEGNWFEFIFTSHITSVEQLKLSLRNGPSIIIAPQNKAQFIEALRSINPGIVYK